MESFSWLSVLVMLFAGLAVFLLGLDTLTGALKAQTGDGLRTLIARLTRNRFAGLASGAVATILLQSSTITTVISIGLVSAGMLNFTQSLGVVLGANVGTTFTAQIMAFDTSLLGAAMLFGGYFLGKVGKSNGQRLAGSVILGLGLVFLGMDLMSDSVRPLRTHEPFLAAMESLSSPLLGILVGALFTAVVQSSSAATGVAIAMASEGLIPLEAGVAIIIGSNVGTCVTALLAAIGKPAAAVRTAVFHVLVNVGGALAWFVFIDQLVTVAVALAPSYPELSGMARRAAETPRQFAMAHTVFNLSTALVMVWFLGPIGRLLERLIPDREEDQTHLVLDATLLIAPISALEAAREQLLGVGDQVQAMVERSLDAVLGDTLEPVEDLAAREAAVNDQHLEVLHYLQDLLATAPGESPTRRAVVLMEVADSLEQLADVVAMSMIPTTRQRLEAGIRFSTSARESLRLTHEAVCMDLTDAIGEALDRPTRSRGYDGHEAAAVLEEAALRARVQLRDGNLDPQSYAYVSDLIAHYRQLHDGAVRLARPRALGAA